MDMYAAHTVMGQPEKREILRRNCVRFREEAGLSQPQLAALVGVSTSTIVRWEKGYTEPKGLPLVKAAEVFRRKVDDFYNPNPPAPAQRPVTKIAFMWIGPEPPPPDLEQRAQAITDEINDDLEHRAQAKEKGRHGKKL
jgi:transcriptional regulator with XRE-family HTH domain